MRGTMIGPGRPNHLIVEEEDLAACYLRKHLPRKRDPKVLRATLSMLIDWEGSIPSKARVWNVHTHRYETYNPHIPEDMQAMTIATGLADLPPICKGRLNTFHRFRVSDTPSRLEWVKTPKDTAALCKLCRHSGDHSGPMAGLMCGYRFRDSVRGGA